MNHHNQIQVGDILTRPKKEGLITHYGVAIGANAIVQNTPGRGEHVVDLRGFACGLPVKVRRAQANPQAVISRATAVLANPRKYDVFINNCEHTAAKIIKGTPESPQLSLWLGLAAIAGLVFVVRKH